VQYNILRSQMTEISLHWTNPN